MTMNKILLLLIVASGFLLIFYANTDLFRWKSKQIVDRPISASLATIHVIDDKGNVNDGGSRSGSSSSSYRNARVHNDNTDIDQLYRRGHAKQLDNNNNNNRQRNKINNLNFNDNNENNVVIRNDVDDDAANGGAVIGNDYGGDWNSDNAVMNDGPNVDFIRQRENWQRFDANDDRNKAEWPRRASAAAAAGATGDAANRAHRYDERKGGGGDGGGGSLDFDDIDDTASIKRVKYVPRINETEYNIFIIYTKQNYLLKMKFELFIKSLLKYSSVKLHLHIISDAKSEHFAEEILKRLINQYKRIVFYTLYSVDDCAAKISDISRIMMPYFSSHPGSYYSDALFYLSLGLHRVVDVNMRRAILIDCDVVFRTDVKRLFEEFDKFSSDNLFGLAPELTPVYRHILYQYRAKNPYTDFGNPYYSATAHSGKHHKKHSGNGGSSSQRKHGYPGLNSGVVLIDFERVRKSKLYADLLSADTVQRIANKYEFKGHLGDQDYYTLIGYEHPSLIYRMDCVWNRQLCTWWKEHGYSDIFDTFFQCEGRIHLYHGNCNSRVPE